MPARPVSASRLAQGRGWKARSVEAAAARALGRGQRFVDAARELVAESPELDFAVQDVVRRAGLSLRAFYAHFAGKDELLLALYEELVAEAAERAARRLEKIQDPLEALKLLVFRFYGERGAFGSSIAAEVHHLAHAKPEEIRTALEPLLALFARVIEQGIAAGAVRSGDARQHAMHVLLVLLIHTQARGQGLLADSWPTLSREQLWSYCRDALRAS